MHTCRIARPLQVAVVCLLRKPPLPVLQGPVLAPREFFS